MKKLYYLFLVGIVCLSFLSCTKFEGSQEIPAYICIKPWTFTTDYDREGANTQAITDGWVYIDGNLQGCYELREKTHDSITDVSVTVPILAKGSHKLTLYPGIKLNGISSTRVQYPFYRPYIIEDLEFTPGMVDTVYPSTRYYDIDDGNLHFKMMEDFESYQLKFTKTSSSDTTIFKVSRRPNDENYDENAWTGDLAHSVYSGKVWLGTTETDTATKFCIATDPIYNLPNQGNSIILEIDYKCDSEFEVGLYGKTQDGIESFELVYLRATDKWKKAYINLGPTITDEQTASYFKVYITGAVTTGETANYYFDNIKLVYRD